jgi:hypothetical protein
VFSQAPQAEATTTLEQLFSGNPKVTGAMNALVEAVAEAVETRQKLASKRSKPWSAGR